MFDFTTRIRVQWWNNLAVAGMLGWCARDLICMLWRRDSRHWERPIFFLTLAPTPSLSVHTPIFPTVKVARSRPFIGTVSLISVLSKWTFRVQAYGRTFVEGGRLRDVN
jgi:hypothetical protein